MSKDLRKAMLLAAIPALFGIAGLGQIYACRLRRGILIEIAYVGVILYMVGGFIFGYPQMGVLAFLLLSVFWFLQVRDARDLAKEYNLFDALDVIWYGGFHDRKDTFDIGMIDSVMASPPNESNNKSVKGTCIFVALFGIPVCLLYWSIKPIFIFLAFAVSMWALQWYSRYYRMPKEVAFGEKGIELRFPNGRKTKVPWMAIGAMWLSRDVKMTIAQANVYYFEKNAKHLSYDVALELRRRYEESTGRSMRMLTDKELNKYQETIRKESESLRDSFSKMTDNGVKSDELR